MGERIIHYVKIQSACFREKDRVYAFVSCECERAHVRMSVCVRESEREWRESERARERE
jgi:hypothetical protein